MLSPKTQSPDLAKSGHYLETRQLGVMTIIPEMDAYHLIKRPELPASNPAKLDSADS